MITIGRRINVAGRDHSKILIKNLLILIVVIDPLKTRSFKERVYIMNSLNKSINEGTLSRSTM